MKTTIDLPREALDSLLRFTGAKTKNEAINLAVEDYNRRQRLARLARKLGTFTELIALRKLEDLRADPPGGRRAHRRVRAVLPRATRAL